MYKAKTSQRGVWKAVCDVCGFTFNSDELKERWDGLMVCKDDWEPRNILDFYRPVKEDISVPWARPDNVEITSYVSIDDTDSPYTATVSIFVIDVDAVSGNVTIMLPLASTYTFANSQQLQIRRTDASTNTVTIQRQGADTINGGTSEVLPPLASRSYQNNAISAWTTF